MYKLIIYIGVHDWDPVEEALSLVFTELWKIQVNTKSVFVIVQAEYFLLKSILPWN